MFLMTVLRAGNLDRYKPALRATRRVTSRRDGFSLIELALVLVVVALLLGGLLVPLTMQIEQQKIRETQKAMEEIKEALVGYALAKGYFPCPAVSAVNGVEDRILLPAPACAKRAGFVPWAELGVSRSDAWGRMFRYSVSPEFSNSVTRFTLMKSGDIVIKATASDAVNVASGIPAVVMSHGKNGFLAATESGVAIANGSVTNADEQTNAPPSPGTLFVSKIMTENAAATGGELDDLVSWVSPNILFNRMVTAGRLP
jgi:prepilin-type N-terminal cleavage/methylation domain-containing protein